MTTCNAELTFPPAPGHLRPQPQMHPRSLAFSLAAPSSVQSLALLQYPSTSAISLLSAKSAPLLRLKSPVLRC
jgi:hypothetical protein